MPYLTGSATSLVDLLGVLQAGCVAHGWTQHGKVLTKGACATQLELAGNDLVMLGGTGVDAQQALVRPGPQLARIGATYLPLPLVFPLAYHLHVLSEPDEVYLCLNHSVNAWQWLAFGCSPAPGLPGTGGWYAASSSNGAGTNTLYLADNQGGGYSGGAAVSGGLFIQNGGWIDGWCANAYLHHGLEGLGWSLPNGYAGVTVGVVDAWGPLYPMPGRLPNAFNGESVLLPIQPITRRTSNKVSIVGRLAHARYVRVDNLADGEVIPLGPDRWKSYPFLQKNAAVRYGGASIQHSGTFGFAVRYDGP